MSAWGTAILSNDLAADVAAEYRELIEDGKSGEEATAEIIASYGTSADDPDERTAFWTGLALAQFKLGRLQESVRDRALEIIDAGGDAQLFFTERDALKRTEALRRLRGQLVGPQRAPFKIRRPRPVPSPVQAGDIFELKLDDGRIARFRTIFVEEDRVVHTAGIELIDEHGIPYRDATFERRDRRPSPAQWRVIAPRQRDVPGSDVLRITGRETIERDVAVRQRYCDWRLLKEDCARLLDDPDARPPHRPLF